MLLQNPLPGAASPGDRDVCLAPTPPSGPLLQRSSSHPARSRERRCVTAGASVQTEGLDSIALLPGVPLRRKHALFGAGTIGDCWSKPSSAADREDHAAMRGELPRRRRSTLWRGQTWEPKTDAERSRSGVTSPNGDELLLESGLKVSAHRADGIVVARSIVDALLRTGEFRSSMREELQFVREVLQSCAQRFRPDEGKKEWKSKLCESGLDQQTREYLQHFADASPCRSRKTLRQIVQAVIFMRRLRDFGAVKREGSLNTLMEPTHAMREETDKIGSWEKFDVFQLDRVGDLTPLSFVGMTIVRTRGLSNFFKAKQFHAFVLEIEGQYLENPYHNRLHAADVTQCVHLMLANKFTELHVAAALFAALCHDVGHPGVTNAFRTAIADDLAITYNDRSVNENMHCAMAYRTLQLPGCGCFEHLTKQQYVAVRKLVIQLILGTDMAVHFDKLKSVKSAIEESGPDVSTWECPGVALQWVVHTADICSTARPFAHADAWTERLLEEFFQQGDREQELGLAISPLCDRHTVNKTSAQLGFVNFILRPALDVLAPIVEVKSFTDNLAVYVEEYDARLAREKEAGKPEEDKEEVKDEP